MTNYSLSTYVKNRDGRVFLYVYYNKSKFYLPTGMTSTVKIKGREFPREVPGWKAKSHRLNVIFTEVESYIVHNSQLPAKEMKRRLRAIAMGEDFEEDTLVEMLRRFAQTKNTENTRRAYLCTANNVEAFDPNVTMSAVNSDWLRRFEQHERTKCRPSQRKDGKGESRYGRSTNGVAIDLRNIRAVFNWALANEWTTVYPFKMYKIKHEQTRNRNLSKEQLLLIRNHGGRYCDTFMLMFFLIGINISDLYDLPKDCIRDGRLEYRRNKTGRFFSIKVQPEAADIIKRYAGKNTLLNFADTCKDYKVFLHHLNDELKAIVPGCTSYWSRHTWASMAASLDIPVETISAALGHSFGLSVTNIYINYDTHKVDDANRKVIDFLAIK